MRARAIFREAWRNIVSGTARSGTFTLLLTAIATGLVTADLAAVRSIATAADQYQAAGASVVTISAEGRIDGIACEALSSVPGVRETGAFRIGDDGITAAALPSSTIPVLEVTQSFGKLLNADTVPGVGVVISDQVSEALSLASGDTLVSEEGETTITGVYEYPNDGRRAGYGYAALIPILTDNAFDECWVDMWPASAQTRSLLQLALNPGDNQAVQPVLSQLNTTLGTDFDGNARYNDRVTRYAPAASFFLGLGLGYFAVRIRRLHFASALHAGLRKASLAGILVLEVLSWTIPAAIVTACVTAIFAATGHSVDLLANILLASRVVVFSITSPFIGAWAALALTHERHLFRYFKDR